MHELRKKSLAEKASSFWRALHGVSRFELTELRVGVAMSAMGQKQTCAVQNVMSALPPKADMCGATSACPLCANSGHEGCGNALQTNTGVRGRTILISVNSPGCVSTSIVPACCFTMTS